MGLVRLAAGIFLVCDPGSRVVVGAYLVSIPLLASLELGGGAIVMQKQSIQRGL